MHRFFLNFDHDVAILIFGIGSAVRVSQVEVLQDTLDALVLQVLKVVARCNWVQLQGFILGINDISTRTEKY